ncbi:ABC transporter substrate-binding protein [Nitratireductor sp. ZSWI3]|uniref:ABC transporter substrate-binding protein n=1 Tax=Nitratireductor sp. ZSWI3 TaxID=2966359 RepID=UPI002150305F|nr:ABC transporter substrate-binding protein [Nitratireductor sp. ZSWI3]MCR4268927.1 ABC transporter substrate-binding protein [Nitratireductor sp. ZSWI3]
MPAARSLSRRAFVAGLAAVAAAPVRAAPPRIAALDYAVASTMIALGVPPIAIPSRPDWATWVVEPALPDETVNLGSMREVNFEVLQALAPDRIFSSPYLEPLRPYLERIAPVDSFNVHNTGKPPFEEIVAATRRIGAILSREEAAEALIARAGRTFREAGRRCAAYRDRPLFFVNFMDPYHVRVYGRNGIFQDAMDRMGLTNAWTGTTNGWGFATVAIDELAGVEDSHLFYLDPVPPDVLPSLARSPLWQQMPFVRGNRIDRFPTVLMFGALPAMMRFAGELAAFGERDAA